MASNMRKVIFFVLLMAVAYMAYAFMIRPANKYSRGAEVADTKSDAEA